MKKISHVSIIQDSFGDIEDPRRVKNTQHLLIEIIVITICAVICGAKGWEDIETFAKAREIWLRGFLSLPYGIPKDTYRRVFARMKPEPRASAY